MIKVSQSRVKVPDNPGPAGLRLHQPGPGQLHHRQGGGSRGGMAPVRESAPFDERQSRSLFCTNISWDVGDQNHRGYHQTGVGEIHREHCEG